MRKQTLTAITLLIIFAITACGGGAAAPTETLQPPPLPATPTETLPQPTLPPAIIEAPSATKETRFATVSFTNDVVPIFEAKCIKCHGVETKKEGLDMRTYDDILKGSRKNVILVPGNTNESLFIQLIIQGEMPNRGPRVTPDELQLIMDWVNQGALNN
jgi:mono/diheme cytochrome c family protein